MGKKRKRRKQHKHIIGEVNYLDGESLEVKIKPSELPIGWNLQLKN